MRDSLISKFQGAYLGCLIGQQFVANTQSLDYSLMNNLIVQELINNCKSNLVIWREYFSQVNTINLSDIALNLLPWILLYHDTWVQLQELINQVSQNNNLKDEDRELLEIWIEKIVFILRKKRVIKNLSTSIISNKNLKYQVNIEQLNLIITALSQGYTYRQLIEALFVKTSDYSRIELLVSWYLFETIPEDFSLMISRSVAVAEKFPNTLSLLGIMAGAYNGFEGIPLSWLYLNQNHQRVRDSLNIIKKLFSFWSGVYHYNSHSIIPSLVAIPHTFQPRSKLKIISQREYE